MHHIYKSVAIYLPLCIFLHHIFRYEASVQLLSVQRVGLIGFTIMTKDTSLGSIAAF